MQPGEVVAEGAKRSLWARVRTQDPDSLEVCRAEIEIQSTAVMQTSDVVRKRRAREGTTATDSTRTSQSVSPKKASDARPEQPDIQSMSTEKSSLHQIPPEKSWIFFLPLFSPASKKKQQRAGHQSAWDRFFLFCWGGGVVTITATPLDPWSSQRDSSLQMPHLSETQPQDPKFCAQVSGRSYCGCVSLELIGDSLDLG